MISLEPHILVIDDDKRLCNLIKKFLVENHYTVVTSSNTSDARKLLKTFDFDLIISDIMMPGENGIEFTKWLQTSNKHPILLLTAKDEIDDRIKGLEAGADDYLSKPFEPRELVLRIQAILKRSQQMPIRNASSTTRVNLGKWFFNSGGAQLENGDDIQPLTNAEKDLLNLLLKETGQVISRESLCKNMGLDPFSRALDVQVTRLRKKIEKDASKPVFLQTVRGKGYILYIGNTV